MPIIIDAKVEEVMSGAKEMIEEAKEVVIKIPTAKLIVEERRDKYYLYLAAAVGSLVLFGLWWRW